MMCRVRNLNRYRNHNRNLKCSLNRTNLVFVFVTNLLEGAGQVRNAFYSEKKWLLQFSIQKCLPRFKR